MTALDERGRGTGYRAAVAALRESGLRLEDAGVSLADEWFSIRQPLAVPLTGDLWSVIRDHAAPAALVLDARDGTIGLRADVPIDDDERADLSRRVRAACAAVRSMPAVFSPWDVRADAVPAGRSAECLAERIRAAGWPSLERPDGRFAVELEVADGYCQATAEPGAATLRLAVEIVVAPEAPTEPARTALAQLLLRTAAAVRLVCPFARESAAGAAAGFAAVCSAEPTAAELTHALRALSVASAHSAREAAALQRDPDLACRYLARQAHEQRLTANRPVAACAAGSHGG